MRRVWCWLRHNSEPIVALATSIQVVAVIFAVTQLYLTKVQIEDARKGLRANVEFQIQHDGRELLGSLTAEKSAIWR